MLAVTIKNLEVNCGNTNLLLGKSTIWFELRAQKMETGKQVAGTLYYKY